MKKTGLADNPLFSVPKSKEGLASPSDKKQEFKEKKQKKGLSKDNDIDKQSRNRDTTTPRYHDTTVSRYHDTIIEVVRKAVKDYGKEAATHRFTLEEKKEIVDIIYAFKNRKIRTSENEIARIAVNFVIQDFKENGETSILDQVLKALND